MNNIKNIYKMLRSRHYFHMTYVIRNDNSKDFQCQSILRNKRPPNSRQETKRMEEKEKQQNILYKKDIMNVRAYEEM